MKQVYIKTRSKWRDWLEKNHDREADGIWLIFYKKQTNKTSLDYEDAVEEALCFGWIDSVIKKIDEEKYARKFTPRKEKSIWSELNKKRAHKMLKENKMAPAGLAKIQIAKNTGIWRKGPRPEVLLDMAPEFVKALDENKKAKENFDTLAPSYRKYYIGWISYAKRPETKQRRIDEAITLLEQGKKLGMK